MVSPRSARGCNLLLKENAMSVRETVETTPISVSVRERFAIIQSYFQPETVGIVNDTAIKFTKLKGEFPWHFHEAEDELFFVVKGRLLMKLRTGDLWIDEGSSSWCQGALSTLPLLRKKST
jgi:mannose-6-phosphate isomerase-like protein (cupin superfamily)